MDEEERRHHSYLGDGVYAQWDGYGMWLRTQHHTDEQCEDKIYLEPSVLRKLTDFYNNWTKNPDVPKK